MVYTEPTAGRARFRRPRRLVRAAVLAAVYLAATAITLTAQPATGWTVTGWNGSDDDPSTADLNTVTMPSAVHTITVNYGQCFELALSHTGSGLNPIAAPANSPGCALGAFTAETAVTLTAGPDLNWTVTGWHGSDDDGSIAIENKLTMPAFDHGVSVEYRRCHALSLSKNGSGDAIVTDPTGSSGCASGRFLAGAAITLTASPDNNWIVGGWLGTDNDASLATHNTITMPAGDHVASVTYLGCHNLLLHHSGDGANPATDPANSPGCSAGRFLSGTTITLTAAPRCQLDRGRLDGHKMMTRRWPGRIT